MIPETQCNGCGDCCEKLAISVSTTKLYELSTQSPRHLRDATFIGLYWIELGDGRFRCRMFDPETRRCTAYAARPPICRDFPFYDQQPEAPMLRHYTRCSFWADVPGVPVKLSTKR